MDRGAWQAAVHGMAKSRTRLSDFTFTFHFHALEKEMATHSSVLAWRIPGTTEPGGLPSMGSHRVGHDWSDLAAAAAVVILILICKMILQTAHLKQSRGFTRWTEESSRLYSEIMDLGVLSCVWSSNEMNGFFFFFFSLLDKILFFFFF